METQESQHPADSAATKRRILDAASEEFSARGFAGARVAAIADQAEANKQLIYRYFGNKQALYEAVFLDMAAQIRASKGDGELSRGQSVFESMLGREGELEHLTSRMVRTVAWEGLAAHTTDTEVSAARRSNYAHAVEWVAQQQAAGQLRSDCRAEDIVALVVTAGGLPYSMTNVFEFVFGHQPTVEDRREWRGFVMKLLQAS